MMKINILANQKIFNNCKCHNWLKLKLMSKTLYYFGCWGPNKYGHYLYDQNGRTLQHRDVKIPGFNTNILGCLDGTLAPGGTQVEFEYTDNVLQMCRVLSWWDRTGDHRPGSNSNLIGFGYKDAEEMIADANIKFPTIMSRQSLVKKI